MAAELISQIFSHLPMLFFIGVTIWCASSDDEDDCSPSGEAVEKLYEQHVAETRRVNATLELVGAIIKRRSQG
jgi:hypothetical protein